MEIRMNDDRIPSSEEALAPISFSYSLSIGGLDTAQANKLSALIQKVVDICNKGLDLTYLEGITVTPQYAETLANFDRGFQSSRPLKPTQEDFAVGAAMLVHVKRGDEFRCHLVIDAAFGAATVGDSPEYRSFGVGLLFHEMAHVHDFKKQCEIMPGLMFKPLPYTLDSWLYNAINGVWSEYFACCIAASADEKAIDGYADTFAIALKKLPEELRTEVIAYRAHNNLNRLLEQISGRIGALFQYAGYVLGHLEGVESTLEAERPEIFSVIQEQGFAATWSKLRQVLKEMFDAYPNWPGIQAYNPLGVVFLEYLRERGILLSPLGRGFNVHVPMTRSTMPPEAHYLFDLHQVDVLN
jgi:hypothetical protein